MTSERALAPSRGASRLGLALVALSTALAVASAATGGAAALTWSLALPLAGLARVVVG